MIAVHPQFITDSNGNKISAVLPIDEYNKLIEELEDLEDIQLFDKANKEDDKERILFSDYLEQRKSKGV